MFRYDATITAHTPNGYYVAYDEWGNAEEVCLFNRHINSRIGSVFIEALASLLVSFSLSILLCKYGFCLLYFKGLVSWYKSQEDEHMDIPFVVLVDFPQ